MNAADPGSACMAEPGDRWEETGNRCTRPDDEDGF